MGAGSHEPQSRASPNLGVSSLVPQTSPLWEKAAKSPPCWWKQVRMVGPQG